MSSTTDFASLQESVQKALINTVKTSNRIANEDLPFQRTVNPDVATLLDARSQRLRDLSTRLLGSAAKACGLKSAPKIEDAEDVEGSWSQVVDVVDTVLEKADTALDEYTGLIKRKEPPTDQGGEAKKQKSKPAVIRNANISKPQATFELQPDNFPTGPWKPILTKKPHATRSLEKSLEKPNSDGQYAHPYEAEITANKYPAQAFSKAEPIPYQPMDQSKPTFVDTYEGVLEMLETLKGATEIAVDLEHHDFRTYTGLVCLMQISTREQDWIVDTLKPWRHKLEVLNEVFADPAIVKVFHGAYMDMIWLQRDLGLYVNGLFDTFFACELLGYPGRGLAYLLSTFAGFTADKQYQLADWRMRPLPKEMLYYARSDTHYLLYIYDKVRNELIDSSDRTNPETDLIQKAIDKSRDVSLYRHEHADFNPATGEGARGWYNYVLKNPHLSFDAEQFAVFRALWKWRDEAARKEDENPNFILGSQTVCSIAKNNPPDAKALHSLLPFSPPFARQSLTQIWDEIKKTKAEGGPTLLQFFTSEAPDALRRNGPKTRAASSMPLIEGELAVRSLPRSQLFGKMPMSSLWEGSKAAVSGEEDSIPFPWQRFVDEAAQGDVEVVQDDVPMAETEPEPAVAETSEEEDEEFTLKRGKKRKAEAHSPSASDEEDDADASGILAIDDDAPRKSKSKARSSKSDKKARREQRKAHKAESKASRSGADSSPRQDVDGDVQAGKRFAAVPPPAAFDYSQAASVMHASRDKQDEEKGGRKGKKGKKEKVFDPYVKSVEEGVKGARKMMPIKGERSATFRK